jgi:eukaryotic-like serine/threonine-protein kinase
MSEPTLAIERSKAVICRNLFNDASDLLRLDRFELVRTLGSGGTGVVYEAQDPRRGERVALKMLNGRGAGDLYRLKREFRALAELAHPNLVSLYELSIAPQHAFFTMELVPGEDIVSSIRCGAPAGAPPPDAARLRHALAQLCEGIRTLHQAGKLHRDLKPSNVLMTANGRVVLLDFGLVQDLQEPGVEIEGTPGYMAPEQRRGSACKASDWYAFGRILQQALRGELEHSVRRSGPQAGGELWRLAARLLEPEPERRPGFQEIAAIVGGPSVSVSTARAPQPSALQGFSRGDAFIGRAEELAALERAFVRSQREPVLVLLRGESGIGKTTLMRRFLVSTPKASAALVLSSRCYEHEFISFKALDGAIDELSRHLRGMPPEQLVELSGDERRALLHLFPVLGRVPRLAPQAAAGEDVHPMVQRRRGFDALKKVLAALARKRPLVLCIDDLQWSDADSGVLLSALLCDRDAPPLLVIASDRTDPGRLNPAIEELARFSESAPMPATIEELTLGALPAPDAALLARALFRREGGLDAALQAQVLAESRGNPLFLKELSRWAATGPAGSAKAASIDAIVGGRADLLSSAGRAVLELLAIAGRPLSTAVIARALELPGDLHPLSLELRRARLVHLVRRADAELLELDHDRIGEAVLRELDAVRRKELHAQLARALEADELHGESALAQYIAAGLQDEAAQRARQAGYLALAALAFARAAWLFRTALELGRWSDATRAHLFGELALALEHAGRGLEAAEAYRRAAALTEDPAASVPLEVLAAGHLARNGRKDEGFALVRHCYELLGIHWPRRRAGLAFSLLKLLVLARLPRRRRRHDAAAAGRARVRMLSDAGPVFDGYEIQRALYNALLALREGEALRDEEWRARARGLRGLMRCGSLLPGGVERGIGELEASAAAAHALGNGPLAAVQIQCATGHYLRGNPRAVVDWGTRCEANLLLSPRAPVVRTQARGIVVAALYDLGELREAQLRWSDFARDVRMHDDVLSSFWAHAHPVQLASLFASEDRAGASAVLHKQAQLRARYPSFQPLAYSHALSRVENALYWDDPEAAYGLLESDWPVLSGMGFPPLNAVALTLRARASVALAARLAPGMRRRWLLWRAWLDVRSSRAAGPPAARAGALFVRASVALLNGRRAAARRQLEHALRVLDAAGGKLLAASARYCLGALETEAARRSALQAAAARVLNQEGIVSAPRWVAWTVPGFRSITVRSEG